MNRLSVFRKRFEKVDLVILDEMGYLPFSKEGAELLFQIISDFYEQKSIIITSNLEFSQWNKIFTDSRLTAALVDRLIITPILYLFMERAIDCLMHYRREIKGWQTSVFLIAFFCTFLLQNTPSMIILILM